MRRREVAMGSVREGRNSVFQGRSGLERLAENPRLGGPLHGDLVPFWSHRVDDDRAVYEIRDEEPLDPSGL